MNLILTFFLKTTYFWSSISISTSKKYSWMFNLWWIIFDLNFFQFRQHIIYILSHCFSFASNSRIIVNIYSFIKIFLINSFIWIDTTKSLSFTLKLLLRTSIKNINFLNRFRIFIDHIINTRSSQNLCFPFETISKALWYFSVRLKRFSHFYWICFYKKLKIVIFI